MSISQNEIINYSILQNCIKNCRNRKEKFNFIISIIDYHMSNKIEFSIRGLANVLKVSRNIIKKAFLIISLPFLIVLLGFKEETRGRKLYEDNHPEIIDQLYEICEFVQHADKSLRDDTIYVDYTLSEMKEKLIEKYNYSKKDAPCENTIRRIIKDHFGYKLTKINKCQVLKKIPETDEIFDNVQKSILKLYNSSTNTIGWSIDDKAKYHLGNLSYGGKSYADKKALDHDTTFTETITPFGILDLITSQTYVFCTNSNSTAEFKADCMEKILLMELAKNPNINTLMLFLDNGPENNSSRSLWIYKLYELAKKYNIKIQLVYYPPYHSKYNRIEHYWGVLQKRLSKEIIINPEQLIAVINSTKWHGINSIGYYDTKVYEKGIKIDDQIMEEIKNNCITYTNEKIKKWSQIINPQAL